MRAASYLDKLQSVILGTLPLFVQHNHNHFKSKPGNFQFLAIIANIDTQVDHRPQPSNAA